MNDLNQYNFPGKLPKDNEWYWEETETLEDQDNPTPDLCLLSLGTGRAGLTNPLCLQKSKKLEGLCE